MIITENQADPSGITVPTVVTGSGEVVASGFFSRLGAAAIGFVAGGPAGAAAGFVADPFAAGAPATAQCPPFTIQVGDKCIDPLAAAPGGRELVTRATGGSVGFQGEISEGIFGLLSTLPDVVGDINGRPILRCPVPGLVLGKDDRCYSKKDLPGLVLGKDDRCYSKKDLPAKLRKWPPHKCRSATDRKIKLIKGAGAAADSLKKAFKGSGFKISKTGK